MYPFLLLALNSLILLTSVTLNMLVGKSVNDHNTKTKVIYGFVISILLYFVMTYSFEASSGVIYDSRLILLGVSTLFYHPVTTLIATTSALVIRFYLGGVGVFAGTLEILAIVMYGMIARYYLFKKFSHVNKYLLVWLYVFITQIILAIFHFVIPLPFEEIIQILRNTMPAMLLVYPLIMVLVAIAYYRNEEFIANAKALRQTERQYIDLFNNVPVGILHFDKEGKVLSFNNNLINIFGTTSSRFKTRNVLTARNMSITDSLLQSLKGENSEYNGPYKYSSKSQEVYIHMSVSPVYDINENVIGGVAVFEDLTEKRQKEVEHIDFLVASLFEKSPREKSHSERVSFLAGVLGKKLGFTDQEVETLKITGILHDIGKLNIDESILEKKDALTAKEYNIIKKHPLVGYRVLSTVAEYKNIGKIVLHHHEKWDGTGYPDGLKGEEIPLHSRILAICDTYDAMTNTRPYRDSLSKEDAIAEIKRCSGTQFDPDIVPKFIEFINK